MALLWLLVGMISAAPGDRNGEPAPDTMAFTSTFLTHCRADRVEWKGQFTLRK